MLLGSTMVLRRKFDPADCLETVEKYKCDALIVIPVMMQRILKLPEEERSGDYSSLRVVAASGFGAARRPRHQVDGHLRREPLQHLRLDRGRVGDDRPAQGHARGRGHGRQGAVQHRGPDLRRGRQPRQGRRVRPHLRRQHDALRRLHRRRGRDQGHDRRPDVRRRHRPARRGGPALHRGPRRRDDRLRRGERLPQGGRGLPREARERPGRGGRSASRTTTTACGCVRSWSRTATSTRTR